MKAVILAEGLGTRISEETYPKPMIEVGGFCQCRTSLSKLQDIVDCVQDFIYKNMPLVVFDR